MGASDRLAAVKLSHDDFGTANDKARRYPLWPAGVPLELPMADCDRILASGYVHSVSATRQGRTGCGSTWSRHPPARPPLTVRLLPADDAMEARLRRLRDRLAEVTGIREPDHDRYRFHITLAYQVAPLTPKRLMPGVVRWRHGK